MNNKIQAKALQFSIIDGALSAVMGSLAGGIFLMGFALKILKAQPQQIGILAALPMFANLIQIFGSYVIEKTGKKKMLCFLCVFASRALWLLIILLPLKIFAPLADFRVWVLVAVIGLSSLFGSLSSVAWLAWMSELVPEDIRGSYFGKRNMIASACGMVVVLSGGKFITLWENRFSETNPYSFIILFIAGLAAGLIATWFISRTPELGSPKKDKAQAFSLSVFFNPLKDRNFLTLILFVSAWMFGIQIAGPFYGVFMINNLKIDFSTITILGTFATLATLFMMKIWGPISDKLGNKPVIIVSGWVLIIVPFIWILALPGKYYLPVLVAHILSGAFMAGATLSQFNILIKLSPGEGRSVYLALFAAITGFVGAVAPILGGSLSKILESFSFTFYAYQITNLHIIFLISSVLQMLTIFFILKVKEPKASTPVAVIMQLKNDLNPQVGIGGAADFLMVEFKKGEDVLRKVDRVTDGLAEKSEEKIEKALDKGAKIIKKPLDKLKDFLKDED
ncbi:MAG: MFS transporter [Candidatus Omnitrophota bacterium]|nr:MAG: MFS transporter [Candidatus Omnitrophota bacterium]